MKDFETGKATEADLDKLLDNLLRNFSWKWDWDCLLFFISDKVIKNINIITDFITIIGSKYENIWTEDIDNYFTELAHFNSININWYSNGIFIAGLITNKLIGYSEIKNLILVNKKDINKIVEIKFRIISGINSIGVKNLIKILPGANNKKYLANLNAIISRINSINSSNSLLNNAREFSKTLTKELTTKSANRFELLQEMMSEL